MLHGELLLFSPHLSTFNGLIWTFFFVSFKYYYYPTLVYIHKYTYTLMHQVLIPVVWRLYAFVRIVSADYLLVSKKETLIISLVHIFFFFRCCLRVRRACSTKYTIRMHIKFIIKWNERNLQRKKNHARYSTINAKGQNEK